MKFLIVGCQRSGTTLLRLILDSHSKVSCFDESISHELLAKGNDVIDDFVSKAGMSHLGFKIPRFTEQLDSSELQDFGLNFTIDNFYRSEPIIFLSRDCRDVVCSMLNLKIGEDSWLQTWGIPIIEYWLENSEIFKSSFGSTIQQVKDSNYYEVKMGALYWVFKNSAYLRYLQKGYPLHFVKYEDLVSNPKRTIQSIARFLGLLWEDSLLKHHEKSHSELSDKGLAVGRTDPKRRIDNSKVGQYQKQLTQQEQLAVLSVSESLLKKLGYSVGSKLGTTEV